MGRKIRRVPAGWEHPRQKCTHSPWMGGCEDARRNGGRCYQPLHDEPFEDNAREWLDAAIAWDRGADPDCVDHKATHPFYWQWVDNPPDPKYYRPSWPAGSAMHYQLYETVSEGTPLTPPFATKEELIEHLAQHGDNWGHGQPWTRENAEALVREEWAPSMIIAGGVIFKPEQFGEALEKMRTHACADYRRPTGVLGGPCLNCGQSQPEHVIVQNRR